MIFWLYKQMSSVIEIMSKYIGERDHNVSNFQIVQQNKLLKYTYKDKANVAKR